MEASRESLDLARPRGVGQLLATTFALFARHSGLFLSLALLVVAPVVVLVDGVLAGRLYSGEEPPTADAATTASALLLTLVLPTVVTALYAVVVRELGAGRVPEMRDALRGAGPRLPAAFAAVVLYAVGVFAGLLLFVVPGVWLGVRWYFAAQAAVLERAAPFGALRRSAGLVDGRWWATFGALLASWVAFGLVTLAMQVPIELALDDGVLYVTCLTVAQAVGLALSALFGTLLFFTLRARTAGPAALA